MSNHYLYEKLAQARYQERLREAEQERMLAQLPRHHPHLVRNVADFLMCLYISAKKALQAAIQGRIPHHT